MPGSGGEPRILGFSGGSNPVRALSHEMRESTIPTNSTLHHDSAAVLICGGTVVAGIEEERLNRLKHTNRLPAQAIRACLDIAGLAVDEIDRFVYYGQESTWDQVITSYMLRNHQFKLRTAREYFAHALSRNLGCDVDPARLAFVEHHLAHATSVYAVGPFTDALVVTLDGQGDGLSGSVWIGQQGNLRRLLNMSHRDSLGLLYLRTIEYLAYGYFDEYKVMGLAPYGDPQRFRSIFEDICRLRPKGRFEVRMEYLRRLSEVLPRPRRASEPLTEMHRDLAAALQEAVERASLHLLTYYRKETGLNHLCLAGGVAHNSTMVGRIARSGLFDGVFTQPASHDAGCALGAALTVHRQLAPERRIEPLSHVYWGTNVGKGADVLARLEAWSDIVQVVTLRNVAGDVADLIANGAVVGWVQGRSEFGPRALGNRSILADPRPAANKDRINDMVKQREAYRPFAPAVLEEYANELFEMPPAAWGAFMTFTVPVRAHMREVLGATTHVDGTARVQTVSRATNERFWALIEAFRERTGTPALLNTSFNHSVEPIVDSLDDALTCFLTTGLSHLIIDEYLVTKRTLTCPRVLHLVPTIPDHVSIAQARQVDMEGRLETVYSCEHRIEPSKTRRLTRLAYRVLELSDGRSTIEDLMGRRAAGSHALELAAEIEELWSCRLLKLRPAVVLHNASSAKCRSETMM